MVSTHPPLAIIFLSPKSNTIGGIHATKAAAHDTRAPLNSSSSMSTDETTCPDCGLLCAGSRGLGVHRHRSHKRAKIDDHGMNEHRLFQCICGFRAANMHALKSHEEEDCMYDVRNIFLPSYKPMFYANTSCLNLVLINILKLGTEEGIKTHKWCGKE